MPTHELAEAYRALFQVEGLLAPSRLTALTPAELKSAFRSRALQTHPDRAPLLGEDEKTLRERFTIVAAAYRRLQTFLSRGAPRVTGSSGQPPVGWQPGSAFGSRRRKSGRHPRPAAADHFFEGETPDRGLLLGEFLYFSGAISWRALIDAITWQRQQRPLIGELAAQLGLLTPSEVAEILARRRSERRGTECFVRFARMEGYLTPYQRALLLGWQRHLQRPFGEFFAQRGILGVRELRAGQRPQVPIRPLLLTGAARPGTVRQAWRWCPSQTS